MPYPPMPTCADDCGSSYGSPGTVGYGVYEGCADPGADGPMGPPPYVYGIGGAVAAAGAVSKYGAVLAAADVYGCCP